MLPQIQVPPQEAWNTRYEYRRWIFIFAIEVQVLRKMTLSHFFAVAAVIIAPRSVGISTLEKENRVLNVHLAKMELRDWCCRCLTWRRFCHLYTSFLKLELSNVVCAAAFLLKLSMFSFKLFKMYVHHVLIKGHTLFSEEVAGTKAVPPFFAN